MWVGCGYAVAAPGRSHGSRHLRRCVGGSAGPHCVTPRGFRRLRCRTPRTGRTRDLQRDVRHGIPAPHPPSGRELTRGGLIDPVGICRVAPGTVPRPVEACRSDVSRTRTPSACDARYGVSGGPCRQRERAPEASVSGVLSRDVVANQAPCGRCCRRSRTRVHGTASIRWGEGMPQRFPVGHAGATTSQRHVGGSAGPHFVTPRGLGACGDGSDDESSA